MVAASDDGACRDKVAAEELVVVKSTKEKEKAPTEYDE